VDVLSGSRRRGETKAEPGGCSHNWCAGRLSVHRVVHPAALVRIRVRLVLVPFPVWILARTSLRISLVLIVLVQISRAPLLVWSGKRQAGVRKGVPLVERSLLDGRTPGRLVSAVPFDRPVGHWAGQPDEWGEAFLKVETVAWRRIEPRAMAAPL
jgi:hypothetical protein